MKIKHQLDMHKACERGFSLIDVAVVMAIVGVLLAGFLATYKMYQATRATTITEENFMAAQDALGAYVSFNNKYPVPSPFGLRERVAAGDTGGSTVYGNAGNPAAAVACTAANASGKVCRGAGFGGNVLIGVLPFAELNLPEAQARDGYGRLFTYAVSEALTGVDGAEPTYEGTPPIPTYKKHVCVGMQYLRDDGGFDAPVCDANSARTIALVSHGSDGIGAWLPSGAQYRPCEALAAGSQNENCDFDGVFTQSMRKTQAEDPDDGSTYELNLPMLVRGDGNRKNDDSIQTEIRQDGNYWAMEQAAGSDPDKVKNRHNYRVGIGVEEPKSMVDVNGNLLADQGVLAPEFCDGTGANCLKLDTLLGAKEEMNCGSLGMVQAIQNNEAKCVHVAKPSTGCASDEFVSGFTADGTPVCSKIENPTCGPAHGQQATSTPAAGTRCLKGSDEGMAGSGTGPYTWRCAIGTKKVNCATVTAPPPAEPVEPPQCIDECGEPRRDGAVWCRAGNPKGKMRCNGTNIVSEGCISGIGCCGAGTLQCR